MNNLTQPLKDLTLDQAQYLHKAASKGNLSEVTAHLKNIPVDTRDQHNRTPLMCAAGYTHVEVVRLLLQNGANPNTQDKYSSTVLGYAIDNLNPLERMQVATITNMFIEYK